MIPTLKRLSLLSLGLGALLSGPALRAQKAADLAPQGTFVAIRFSSLGWLENAKSILAKTMGEDAATMEIPFLKDLHDLGGVNKDKPFYVFMAKSMQGPPWIALPIADPEAFEKGMKLSGKPLVKGSYGLLNPSMVMGGEAPALGEPALGDLPQNDLAVRILGPQALAAMGPQLMQMQMMAKFMAQMSAQGDPKKAQALAQGVDYLFNLVQGVQILDLGFNLSGAGSAQVSLSALPKADSALAGLVKGLKPETPPPALLQNPLIWFSSALPSTKAFPKEIQGLVQALSPSEPGAKDDPASFLTNAGSVAVTITPKGRLLLGLVQKVTDPKAAKALLSSKEKIQGLVEKMVPSTFRKAGDIGEMLSMALDLVKEAEFNPSAFEVDGNPVAGLAIPLSKLFQGAAADEKASFQKLFGGDKLHGLASVLGNKIVLGFGPEDSLQKLFANFGSSTGEPTLMGGALLAGSFRLGSAASAFGKVMGKQIPRSIKLSDLPEGRVRFFLKNDGKQLKGVIGGNLKEIFQVVQTVEKLF